LDAYIAKVLADNHLSIIEFEGIIQEMQKDGIMSKEEIARLGTLKAKALADNPTTEGRARINASYVQAVPIEMHPKLLRDEALKWGIAIILIISLLQIRGVRLAGMTSVWIGVILLIPIAIMTVLDRDERIYAATAGDITESLKAAIDKAHQVFSVEIKEKSDIIIAVAPYPMDIDLYQSQKALDNGKLALNDNGIIILVSKCRMGVGDEAFVKLLSSCRTPQETLDKIDQEYKLGYHKAAKMAEIARWAQMWAVTSLNDDLLKSIFIRPFHSLQEAIDAAVAEKGEEKILFLMNAGLTVPKLRKKLIHRSRKFIHAGREEKEPPPTLFEERELTKRVAAPLARIYPGDN
jgi:hypothetical protein